MIKDNLINHLKYQINKNNIKNRLNKIKNIII